MYFRDKVPEDLSEISDEDVDLRVRITNGDPELIVKEGSFTGSHSRKEVSINFSKEEIQDYIDFLSILGWNIGVMYATEKWDYEYKGTKFSLVKIHDYGYNFEIEMTSESQETEEIKEKLSTLIKELGLDYFSEEELNKQCNEINNKKELQFDFKKQSFENIKPKIEEFF